MTTSTGKAQKRPSRRARLLKRRFSSISATRTRKEISNKFLRGRTHQTSYTTNPYTSSEEELEPDSYPLRGDESFFPRDESRTLHYASLPPTPISPSTPHSYSPPPLLSHLAAPPFSLWDYVHEEILATDFDSHQELKWDRVSNFLNIPLALEKVRNSTTISCDSSKIITIGSVSRS